MLRGAIISAMFLIVLAVFNDSRITNEVLQKSNIGKMFFNHIPPGTTVKAEIIDKGKITRDKRAQKRGSFEKVIDGFEKDKKKSEDERKLQE